ncbi:MAG: hypothetical protein PVJ05_01135 [Candidatus Thorarchaeota archaeon]|jgi:hypothetical protein
MEKSENYWVLLAIIGVVLILLAGFNTTVPIPWLGYLNYGFLFVGIVILILATLEFRKRNKV